MYWGCELKPSRQQERSWWMKTEAANSLFRRSRSTKRERAIEHGLDAPMRSEAVRNGSRTRWPIGRGGRDPPTSASFTRTRRRSERRQTRLRLSIRRSDADWSPNPSTSVRLITWDKRRFPSLPLGARTMRIATRDCSNRSTSACIAGEKIQQKKTKKRNTNHHSKVSVRRWPGLPLQTGAEREKKKAAHFFLGR